MNQCQMKKMCENQVENIIDRMHQLCADGRSDDATALYLEIQDWVINNKNIQVMSLPYISEY